MRIILIDTNAWDLFFDQDLNLSLELPSDEYRVLTTPLLETEINAIEARWPELYLYIKEQLKNLSANTLRAFGFRDLTDENQMRSSRYPENIQIGGFDSGFILSEEIVEGVKRAFDSTKNNPIRGTGLPKHFTDQDLKAYSNHFLVLSSDQDLIKSGYKNIINMTDFNSCGLSLADYIELKLQEN